MEDNINSIVIHNCDGDDFPISNLVHWNTNTEFVSIYFNDIESVIVKEIKASSLVVGCIAWFTNEVIINELAGLDRGCSIIVQKEDFLRPEAGTSKSNIREKYKTLKCGLTRFDMVGVAQGMSYCGDPTIDPVRCVGFSRNAMKFRPNMHHKFIVLCDVKNDTENDQLIPVPKSVITGSYNFSVNSTRSRENIVHIKNDEVANAYFDEWGLMLAISEPLDWNADYIEPEWRIGS